MPRAVDVRQSARDQAARAGGIVGGLEGRNARRTALAFMSAVTRTVGRFDGREATSMSGRRAGSGIGIAMQASISIEPCDRVRAGAAAGVTFVVVVLSVAVSVVAVVTAFGDDGVFGSIIVGRNGSAASFMLGGGAL